MATVRVLTWEGDQTVEMARERKAELLDAFAKADQVVISVSLLGNVDIAFVQLLLSALVTAQLSGKKLLLRGKPKNNFLNSLATSGFPTDDSASAVGAQKALAALAGEAIGS